MAGVILSLGEMSRIVMPIDIYVSRPVAKYSPGNETDPCHPPAIKLIIIGADQGGHRPRSRSPVLSGDDRSTLIRLTPARGSGVMWPRSQLSARHLL